MSEPDKATRDLFREAAAKEGKGLRQWCRDNGIIYETLVNKPIPSPIPLSAVHDHDGKLFGSCPVCDDR